MVVKCFLGLPHDWEVCDDGLTRGQEFKKAILEFMNQNRTYEVFQMDKFMEFLANRVITFTQVIISNHYILYIGVIGGSGFLARNLP